MGSAVSVRSVPRVTMSVRSLIEIRPSPASREHTGLRVKLESGEVRCHQQAGAKSFEEHFNEVVEAVKRKRDDWSAAPPERGQIDGRPFFRLHWTGTGRPVARKDLGGRKMQGFIYFSIVGQNAIIMLAQDVEPEAENTLPLLEAAALTLRKKPE